MVTKKIFLANIPAVILLLIWPFGAYLVTFSKVFKKNSNFIYLFLCCFYCYTVIIPPESDLSRYVDDFKIFSNYDFDSLIKNINLGEVSDLYTILLSYLISFISTDARFFLAIAGLIFSFFYLKTIHLIFNSKFSFESPYKNLFLIFTLYFYIPIFSINNIRFYTAFYVFFYSFLSLVESGNKKYAFLIFIVPLIHVAFFPVLVLYSIFLLFKRLKISVYIILFLSVFISFLFSDLFLNVSSIFSGDSLAVQKLTGYTDSSKIEEYKEFLNDMALANSVRFNIFRRIVDFHYLSITFFAVLLIVQKKLREILFSKSDSLKDFFFFLLCVVFLSYNFPESYRYQQMLCFFYLILITFNYNQLKLSMLYRRLSPIVHLFIGLYVLSNLYINISTISTEFYLSNWLFISFDK